MSREDVDLNWAGKIYKIKAARVMRAGQRIEEVITFFALAKCIERRDIPLNTFSMAYGGLLRFAGAQVTDEDVFDALVGSPGALLEAWDSITDIMLPKKFRAPGGAPEANPTDSKPKE